MSYFDCNNYGKLLQIWNIIYKSTATYHGCTIFINFSNLSFVAIIATFKVTRTFFNYTVIFAENRSYNMNSI